MSNIPYPVKQSEAEIQALLWLELRKHGVDARLQVKSNGDKPRSLLDLVVFKDKVPVFIVECKSWKQSYIRNNKWQTKSNTKQLDKYKQSFGIPVIVCGFQSNIEAVVNLILAR